MTSKPGRYENVDGHRVFVPSDAPSPEPSAAEPSLIGGSGGGSLPDFHVEAFYQSCHIALLVAPEDVPALAAHPLFAHKASDLRKALMDVEQEIEWQIQRERDRQITGGLGA